MRIITIILAELHADKLKQEHQLQQLINSTANVDEVVTDIKNCLRKITETDNMIQTWSGYTQGINNTEQKQENDGKV
tara:strand:+ start:565 stop:795 length:231 start_codon:yes stop_codon:yes gene_type:complete